MKYSRIKTFIYVLSIFVLFNFPTTISSQNINEEYTVTVNLPAVYVYGRYPFKNEKERVAYNKLVRDVRKTYPYARFIAKTIIETYEIMETMPEDEQQKHLENVKKDLMKKYKPEMKKMTKRQGQILMKLIYRESGSSSYNVIKAIVGSFQATTYNVFAGLFGNSLKVKYDPQGKDKDIEQIVIFIQQGMYNDQK